MIDGSFTLKRNKKTVKIILVGSSISGLGKTQLCELLFGSFEGFSALKVTTVRHNHIHHSFREGFSRASRTLSEGFHIEDDPLVLMEKDKDTDRYIRAGAVRALWLTAAPDYVHKGLMEALDHFDSGSVLVIEGNSPLLHLAREGFSPLVVFISATDGSIKESAREVQRRAHMIVPAGEGDYLLPVSDVQRLYHPFSIDGRRGFLQEISRWCGVTPRIR